MPDGTLIFIAAVFAVAGFVKGVIGLGLPTISMGLLAIVMPPIEAAAILILPSLLTNVWQMVAGPSLWAVVRRLWPTMLAVCVGTLGLPRFRGQARSWDQGIWSDRILSSSLG
jgi:uncharacterized membrane protein YfcA